MQTETAETTAAAEDLGALNATASLDCGKPISGVAPLLVSGTIVMLGEMHGTAEIPAFIGDLACLALAHDHQVLLGLEYPVSEQANLDAYLASDGGPAAVRALLASGHWQATCPDGRSSQAMFDLLDHARALRQDDHQIDVFAFDNTAYDEWNRRDSGMAENILARAADAPEAIVFTLTGNLHNRLVPGLPWDDSLVPAGVHVDAQHERVISLDVRHAGGTAWIQQGAGQCGAVEIPGKPVYQNRYVELGEGAGNERGSGIFSVGAINAAPPAAVE